MVLLLNSNIKAWYSFDPKEKISAKIMADGSIKYKKSEGSIHKVAATIMGAESYNGWTYWHCNINGSTVVIDSLRQKFINEIKAKSYKLCLSIFYEKFTINQNFRKRFLMFCIILLEK